MLEWLTATVAPRKRAMINGGGFNRIPDYRVVQLRRQIDQPSLGDLGKLPPELLCMILGHLSCNDLEALRSCSAGAHIAVVSFPLYRTLCAHAPAIIAILKKTRLATSFSITKIYETFASTCCTTCDQFGGYVFFTILFSMLPALCGDSIEVSTNLTILCQERVWSFGKNLEKPTAVTHHSRLIQLVLWRH